MEKERKVEQILTLVIVVRVVIQLVVQFAEIKRRKSKSKRRKRCRRSSSSGNSTSDDSCSSDDVDLAHISAKAKKSLRKGPAPIDGLDDQLGKGVSKKLKKKSGLISISISKNP